MSGPFKQAFKTIGDVTLNMYLFRPDEDTNEANNPVVVFFFCGGWRGFDATKFYPQSTYLARRQQSHVCGDPKGDGPFSCVAGVSGGGRVGRFVQVCSARSTVGTINGEI